MQTPGGGGAGGGVAGSVEFAWQANAKGPPANLKPERLRPERGSHQIVDCTKISNKAEVPKLARLKRYYYFPFFTLLLRNTNGNESTPLGEKVADAPWGF